jgi:DNA-binding NarL/FixJ family response regulator
MMYQDDSGTDPVHLPAIRTLLVDDSIFDRKRIRRLGDRIDLPLVFEETASVAGLKQCLDREKFDLFLIDYAMPEADGLAALAAIRAHGGHAGAASIMISGNSDARVAVAALKQGCHDFIPKEDMSPALLKRAMLAALAGRGFVGGFSPPPFVDAEQMRALMRMALSDQTIRDMLRAPLEEGLQAAARNIGLGWGLQSTQEVQQFLYDFIKPDEFEFY